MLPMVQRLGTAIFIVGLCCVTDMAGSVATAAESDFAGVWMLELDVAPAPIVAQLDLSRVGSAWDAKIEGGPAEVKIDGDQIEVILDSRDIAGFVFYRRLSGRLEGFLRIMNLWKILSGKTLSL